MSSVELTGAQFLFLVALPFISLALGAWTGTAWRRETVRALEKSVEDLQDYINRSEGRRPARRSAWSEHSDRHDPTE